MRLCWAGGGMGLCRAGGEVGLGWATGGMRYDRGVVDVEVFGAEIENEVLVMFGQVHIATKWYLLQ